MGACTFRTTQSGRTMKEAYDISCEYAMEEYGHQEGYNGTISTTDGFRDVTGEFKRSKKSLNDFINEAYDKLSKRNCWGICIEEPVSNKNKTKSQVEDIVTKGTKKWVLKYVALSDYKGTIGKYRTKTEAVKAARKYTEESNNPSRVEMVKELESGTTLVAKVSYKKSSNEKMGRYTFFGWAAE